MKMFDNVYQNKRVLVTGHTGFKGTHLVRWLNKTGARVFGVGLDEGGEIPDCLSLYADIRDEKTLVRTMREFQPDFVFHLAAQAIVKKGYDFPSETFAVNVQGTVNVLEAIRQTPCVKGAVIVTSDKCYENAESGGAFDEDCPMGGVDPYSASKGCAELVVAAYRKSFFNREDSPLIATARGGNVIGGGDFGAYRLVPDVMKAAAKGEKVMLRHKNAVRPWQYVLDALSGYLVLGKALLNGEKMCAGAFNFATDLKQMATVGEAVAMMASVWDKVRAGEERSDFAEAQTLILQTQKAHDLLAWTPVYTVAESFERTTAWYRSFFEEKTDNSESDFDAYLEKAALKGAAWLK